uniref:Kinesin family member 20B n=1 Tax=Anas zonorhyncha TaxID=75864 RepID=A0A8B9TZ85_9AVES
MDPIWDEDKFFRPSYVTSAELPQRTGPRSSLESKGHIEVCLRVRPFTLLEKENESQDCFLVEDSTSIILKPPKNSLNRLSEKTAGQQIQKFTFSQVFGPETTQEEFFEGTMKQPVQDFLEGYDRLIFTYGVTNAGKTYTFLGTEDDIGVLPRTMDMLFKSIQGRLYPGMDLKPHRCRDYVKLTKDQVREETAIKNSLLRLTKEVEHQNTANSKAPVDSKDLEEPLKGPEQSSTTVENYLKFSVWVSFFEIYNECFYDLLVPISNDKKRKTLRLAQDVKGCPYVKDLQWVQISDSREAFRLLKLGLKHQSIASTKLNTSSSRSHSIFTVKVLKIEDFETPRVIRVNELSLCDLAGSERCTKTRNEGDRLKESGNINTSLLILGKCINALKNCQQSKLQQHIPFRESKLTHFLQGFFSGRGKVYMIVNISQCASAYDETLNVLKFSAIAQKVLVMDTSILPHDQSFGQKLVRESSLLSDAKIPIPRKRATILWDRSLEDGIEDDNDEMEEHHNLEREEEEQRHDENQVLIGKEEYTALLSLIKDLKNKLNTEKKNKLVLELKVREEMAQEFSQYMAEWEINFIECLFHECERLEENSERRLEIFKEFVNGYTENPDEEEKFKDQSCSEQAGPLDKTVTSIKRKMAEESSNKVAESSQVKESEETVLEVGRKRSLGNEPTVEEEPPTKKGVVKDSWEDLSIERERTEHVNQNSYDKHMETLALKERVETLESQIAALEQQCRREENEKEEFSEQVTNLQLQLSHSEERATGLSEELQQYRTDYQQIVSELDKQKTINKEKEEKILQLKKEVEDAKQNIIDKVSQIKTMQSKVDKLCKSHLESHAMDLVDLKDSLDYEKEESETSQINSMYMQSQTTSIADPRWESSFHYSVESIWEECKSIIKASSQKSQQIKELVQEVENLKKGLEDSENCNNQLKVKLSEMTKQDSQSIKEKALMDQLKEQIQKKTQDFEKRAAEDHRVITQFEEEVTSYKVKIRELECLLEAFQKKEDSMTKLEEILKQKESIILNLEANTVALQEKCANSDQKIKELYSQEANLNEEVVQLTNSLEKMKLSLWEKEKYENERTQSIELLNKDLLDSSALVQSLKKDLQRKEEDYEDLKKKFSDAEKQIQQVQKEVSTMRSEEKSLRNKVNELEKIKKQLSEELDIKQRAIQQFKREQLSNEKLEEVSRQYENTRKELSAKEKIIEDMRMTLEEQEQTQIEQEQVLEAKLEENSRLVSELEMWKQKYMQLNNQSNTEWQPKMTRNDDTNINGNEELIKLQKELKENEAKYQTDRKKWMEEKKGLIDQVKEAESHRNREMKKFAEDRERHIKQQAEIERLAAQLVEKDSDLSKWREERDKLVEALEVQLKTLASKTIQKDKEIAELKQSVLKDSGKDNETVIELRKQLADKEDFIKELKKCINHESLQFSPEVPLHEESQDTVDLPVNKEFMKKRSEINPITGDTVPIRHEVKENDSNSASSLSETEEHSETVLDSSEVSTENGRTSRFPKPEMEIQFTPLQPNKMEVKHQGSALPVTVKMLKTRSKRKSDKMDEDFVKSENKKNEKSMAFSSPSTSNKKMVSTTQTSRKEYSLRKQESTSNKRSARKKDGTLQRLGGFSQSSPTIIHSKAKKQMATISSPKSSPKSSEPESLKGNEIKPKRAKRKLYSTDISSPLDISASSIFIEQNEKESDHLIIKRRLRSKPAK